jgi:hypothetical protein
MIDHDQNGGRDLNELFSAYREACAAPEAGADFMPRLWERIESRRRWTDPLWRWANGLAAAAAAASLFFVFLQFMPTSNGVASTRSYVELLAEAHESDDLELQLASISPTQPGQPNGAGR